MNIIKYLSYEFYMQFAYIFLKRLIEIIISEFPTTDSTTILSDIKVMNCQGLRTPLHEIHFIHLESECHLAYNHMIGHGDPQTVDK